ncbi:MAG: cryptochrome/photolyase family protein [Flavobacteriales bacterium]|nr:cryptochrome/photolyase family protein [Flavobacteriales bacterium]
MKPQKDSYTTLRLILGDQLNYLHSWYQEKNDSVLYVIMEVRQETDYVRHHIQKVIGFFAAMYNFAQWLSKQGHHVYHLKINDPENDQSITKNLDWLMDKYNIQRFEYQWPDEYRLDEQIKAWLSLKSIKTIVYDSEHFITTRDELKEIFRGKKHFLMETFYRNQRKKTRVLMLENKPLGGIWNYDAENRHKYSGKELIPQPLLFFKDLRSIEKEIHTSGIKTIGSVDAKNFTWPVTRKESLELLNHFIEHALPWFGHYQDAMVRNAWLMFHSKLSFSLNTKMLHPMEVIQQVEDAWKNNPKRYPLASVEGFIRQVLGWREYVRGIYWMHMPEYATLNYFKHQATLPTFYWTGETQMECMRQTIQGSLQHAYAHHIQRLMVTGAFALLAGVHPDEVDAWYLGIYADAIEWVEMPNTRGMSQYADGGIMATKPYVGSANYMHKMSNYCTSCFYNKSLKYGEKACPFNSLYWHFYHRHRDKLYNNPRIGMMYRTWEKFNSDEQRQIINQAEKFLSEVEKL